MKNRSVWRKLELFIILKNNLLYSFMLQKVGRNLFKIFAWFACKKLVGILTLLLPQIHPDVSLKRFFVAVMAIRVFWKIFPLFLALGIIFFIFAASFCKVHATDILTKTLNWRLSAAIGISQILCCVVITQWSSSIIFGIFYSKYHTKSVGWCIAYLTQQGNARASIAG